MSNDLTKLPLKDKIKRIVFSHWPTLMLPGRYEELADELFEAFAAEQSEYPHASLNQIELPKECSVCGAPNQWVSSGAIPGRAAPLTSWVCSIQPAHGNTMLFSQQLVQAQPQDDLCVCGHSKRIHGEFPFTGTQGCSYYGCDCVLVPIIQANDDLPQRIRTKIARLQGSMKAQQDVPHADPQTQRMLINSYRVEIQDLRELLGEAAING